MTPDQFGEWVTTIGVTVMFAVIVVLIVGFAVMALRGAWQEMRKGRS